MKRTHLLLTGLLLILAQSRGAAALCPTCAYITGVDGVYAWDTSAPSGTAPALVFSSPAGTTLDSLVFDSQGNIIFDTDDAQPNAVYIYHANDPTPTITRLATVGSNLGDLALEPSNTSVLVSSRKSKQIFRVPLSGATPSVFYPPAGTTGLGQPDGIVYDDTKPNPRLFVCLGLGEVAELDPQTGNILPGHSILVPGADGLTYNSVNGKLYAGSNNGGFYTVDRNFTNAVFTDLGGTIPRGSEIDGVGTDGAFLYLVHWVSTCSSSDCGIGIKYDLNAQPGVNPVTLVSPHIQKADDIAPLSGLGSQANVVAVSVSPQTKTLNAAQTQPFTATVTGSADTAVTWTLAGPGTISGANDNPVTYTAPATISVTQGATLTAVSHADTTKNAAAAITLSPGSSSTPPPVITAFGANPTSITSGGSSTLSWTISGATSTFIDQGIGFLSPASGTGSRSVTPAVSTTYHLTAWGLGGSTPAQATVTVTQPPVLSSLQVIPPASVVKPSDTIPFTVHGFDQYGNPISAGTVSWTIASSNGSHIDPNTGVYNAGPSPSANVDTITAHSGSIPPATATVLIQNPGGFQITDITAVPNPVTGTFTTVTVTASDSNGGALTYSWDSTGPNAVGYDNPNNSHSVAHFHATGVHTLTVKVFSTTFPGQPLTASIPVNVIETISKVVVTPSVQTISPSQSANFQAQVLNQFGQAMAGEPVDWSAPAGSMQSSTFFPTVSLVNQTVTVTARSHNAPNATPGTGLVQIVGAGGSFDISNAHAYPVPWKSTGNLPYIVFTGLALDTNVNIYTTNARLVRTLTSSGEDAHWFVNNSDGERVASGVYLYRIVNNTSKQTIKGKLVVIQ